MAEISIPISITYETDGGTPLPDVIAALSAADLVLKDTISLLPSLIDGLKVEDAKIRVQSISQESPLREIFLVGLFIAFQDQLENTVPPVLENIFNTTISDDYNTLVTIVAMAVVFYGAAFAKDLATHMLTDGPARRELNEAVDRLALHTGKTPEQIKSILDSKYAKPTPLKRLVRGVQQFFKPSHREGSTPVLFDRKRVERDAVADVPGADFNESETDFERYLPYNDVTLELHAQDRDRVNTGWAAVPQGIHDQRLKMKVLSPLETSAIWGKDSIRGDIVIVEKAVGDGYVPSEIHLLTLHD